MWEKRENKMKQNISRGPHSRADLLSWRWETKILSLKCLKYGTPCNWKPGVWLRGRVIAQHVSARSLIPRTKKEKEKERKKKKPRKNQSTTRTTKGCQSHQRHPIPFHQTTVHVCISMTYLKDNWEDMGEAFKEEDGPYSQRTLVGIH